MAWKIILIRASFNTWKHNKKNLQNPFYRKLPIQEWDWCNTSANWCLDAVKFNVFRSKNERTKCSAQFNSIVIPTLGVEERRLWNNRIAQRDLRVQNTLVSIRLHRWFHPLTLELLKHECRPTDIVCKFMHPSIFTEELQIVQIPKSGKWLRIQCV